MSKNEIVMIDYGAGNIRSVQKAFEHIGAAVILTDDPEIIMGARKLVLPGVGAFGSGIAVLRMKNLDSAIIHAVNLGVPFLGICLGLQFLFDQSDEMGSHEGLGLIPGQVTRFDLADQSLKVPHMGWNQIEIRQKHPLLEGVPDGAYAYFVHSYYCVAGEDSDVLAQTEYGHLFTSCVARDNIWGIQFHPEKSQYIGLQILRNFAKVS
jgi:imidazole glycerol-phosphate synthase subunit HisH